MLSVPSTLSTCQSAFSDAEAVVTPPTARVYVAAPTHISGTPQGRRSRRYTVALARIAAAHPGMSVVDAATLFRVPAVWTDSYTELVRGMTYIYVLTDDDGYVDFGVYAEWFHILSQGRTRRAILPDGTLWDGIRLQTVRGQQGRRGDRGRLGSMHTRYAVVVNSRTGRRSTRHALTPTERDGYGRQMGGY